MSKWTKKEIEESREELREILPPGTVVYTVVKSVAKSGMSRTIGVYTIKDNTPIWLSYRVARALDWSFDDKKEAIRVSGCGMDMGFHLVYTLSYALHGHGGLNCNDSKRYEDPTPESYRPGYSLIHKWL